MKKSTGFNETMIIHSDDGMEYGIWKYGIWEDDSGEDDSGKDDSGEGDSGEGDGEEDDGEEDDGEEDDGEEDDGKKNAELVSTKLHTLQLSEYVWATHEFPHITKVRPH